MHRKKFLQLSILAPLGIAAKPFHFLEPANGFINNDDVAFYTSGVAVYEQLRKGFNKRIDKNPSVIAVCKNSNGVAAAIQHAVKNNLPVAVKSGGHCMEGFSCNDAGMVINMSEMKSIEWLDKETVKIGPGCKLSDIYNELLPKRKIIPGGSCAGVSIGGLVLGGGYGLMARKFGLTCDSLQGLTMVDGTGKIISASGSDELMWACRGGNNGNFGVVTELVFKVHPAPAMMQSHRFRAYTMNAARAKAILQKWFELTATLPADCFSAFVLNGKTLYILLTNVGKPNIAVKNFIEGMKAVTDKTTLGHAKPLAAALKAYYGRINPMYFKNASAGLYKNFKEIETFVEKALEIVTSTPGMIYQVNTLGGNIQNPYFESRSSFPHRSCNYFSELQTYWELPSQERRLLQRFEAVQQIFSGNGIKAQYRNYPDINFQNWPELYYGNNYKELQAIKGKYDPQNIFRYEQSIQKS